LHHWPTGQLANWPPPAPQLVQLVGLLWAAPVGSCLANCFARRSTCACLLGRRSEATGAKTKHLIKSSNSLAQFPPPERHFHFLFPFSLPQPTHPLPLPLAHTSHSNTLALLHSLRAAFRPSAIPNHKHRRASSAQIHVGRTKEESLFHVRKMFPAWLRKPTAP